MLHDYKKIEDLLPGDIVLAFVNSVALKYSGYVVAPSGPYAVISVDSSAVTLFDKHGKLSTVDFRELSTPFGYYAQRIACICKRD